MSKDTKEDKHSKDLISDEKALEKFYEELSKNLSIPINSVIRHKSGQSDEQLV